MKIAEGSYKLANRRGILKYFLTWSILKDYNSQGTIKRNEAGIKDAAEFLGISISTLRSQLTKLVKLRYIKRNKYSYSLESYDTVWGLLGLDLTPHSKKDRRGSFKIWKLDKENLKEHIELQEIILSVNRQAYKAKQSILKNKSKFPDTEIESLKKCRFMDLPELLDSMYEKRLTVLEKVEEYLDEIGAIKYCEMKMRDYSFIKITPYLTCKNTAEVLGYEPNCRTGQLIRERIQKVGLAKFIRREVVFTETRHSWSNAVKAHKLQTRYPGRVKEDGLVGSHRIISKMVVL